MRILPVERLEPGMLVGRTLLDAEGRILLHQGVALTEPYIRALQMKGFRKLLIRDPEIDDGIDFEEDISEEVRLRAFGTIRSAFEEIESQVAVLRQENTELLKKSLDAEHIKALMSRNGPLAKLHEIVGSIMDEVLTRSTLAGLTSMKAADDAVFNHSIDVCAIGLMVGKVLGLPARSLRQLATGCLLHDIGKVFLAPGMPKRLAIKQHTTLGYEMLKMSEDRDILSPHVAYEHHEHQDGTGLPRGLRGSNAIQRDRSQAGPVPTLIGEICAVANGYDNLLSQANNGKGTTPDVAIRRIREHAGTYFNKAVVTAFFRVVPVYPVGMLVTIRHAKYNNFAAVVLRVNVARLDRPVVRIFQDNMGRRIEPEEVDLALLEGEVALRPKLQ